MANNKFLASSASLLKWLRDYFPNEGVELKINFTIRKGELMVDEDGAKSLFIEASNDFEFTLPPEKVQRIISILRKLTDQPITISISSEGWFYFQSICV